MIQIKRGAPFRSMERHITSLDLFGRYTVSQCITPHCITAISALRSVLAATSDAAPEKRALSHIRFKQVRHMVIPINRCFFGEKIFSKISLLQGIQNPRLQSRNRLESFQHLSDVVPIPGINLNADLVSPALIVDA